MMWWKFQMRQRSPPPHQYQERRSPERERQPQQLAPKQQVGLPFFDHEITLSSLSLAVLQVNLRSRAERDGGGGAQTAGQRRAAAELERIKRDQVNFMVLSLSFCPVIFGGLIFYHSLTYTAQSPRNPLIQLSIKTLSHLFRPTFWQFCSLQYEGRIPL